MLISSSYDPTAPLFRDPVTDGPADPKVVWNDAANEWWMFYTSRRANSAIRDGVSWVHGTDIGVASGGPRGDVWTYRGTLDLDTGWGRNTFWAPEVIQHNGVFHMFVSYIEGVPNHWPGPQRSIRHYVSNDLVNWEYIDQLGLSSDQVIDASVLAIGEGFRMWYKDEADGNAIWYADSADLQKWTVGGRAIKEPFALEGPDVFMLNGYFWMLADAKCQRLYRSIDAGNWEYVDTFLDVASGLISGRVDDLGPALHGSSVVLTDRAYFFYFTHPGRHDPNAIHADHRRSVIHAAEFRFDGASVSCRRGADVTVDLRPAVDEPIAPR